MRSDQRLDESATTLNEVLDHARLRGASRIECESEEGGRVGRVAVTYIRPSGITIVDRLECRDGEA